MRSVDEIPAHVVVVGSFNQDHVWRSERFPQPGETQLGQFSSGPGGKGFNQAIASARQGVETAFISALGRDALGDAAVVLSQSEGLRARWQRLHDVATGTAAILLNGDGENMIVVGPGANAALSAGHVAQQAPLIRAAKVLLTQQETTLAACVEAMTIARQHGVMTLHNPAPESEAAVSRALLPFVDVLTPNETELEALLRDRDVRLPESWLELDDASLHQLCRQLNVPTVVVTLGGAGVFVSHADPTARGDAHAYYRLPAEAATVVDTTGAGDAFNGGLAAAVAEWPDAPFNASIRHAIRVAAWAVEHAGAAMAMPRRAELEARFPAS